MHPRKLEASTHHECMQHAAWLHQECHGPMKFLGEIRKFLVQVRGRGELLAYSSLEPHQCTVNGKPIEFSYSQQGHLTMPIPYDVSEVVVHV